MTLNGSERKVQRRNFKTTSKKVFFFFNALRYQGKGCTPTVQIIDTLLYKFRELYYFLYTD